MCQKKNYEVFCLMPAIKVTSGTQCATCLFGLKNTDLLLAKPRYLVYNA